MNKELLDFIITQGIFAVLFLYLLLYVLKTNTAREKLYQDFLIDFMKLIPVLQKDIDNLKKQKEKD